MIECRVCHEMFRTPPERIGSRCPNCRMPLFERDRPRPPVVDLGACSVHGETSAVAKCQRCGKMMCPACRTRWDEEFVCPSCLDRGLSQGEVSPKYAKAQNRQAGWSLTLALAAWSLLLLTLWILRPWAGPLLSKEAGTLGAITFLAGFLPAFFAIGLGATSL